MSKANDQPKRSHRVPIMLSEQELAKVDEYRFASFFATRAQAVRHLIGVGAFADDMLELLSMAESALSLIIDTLDVDPAETVRFQRGNGGLREITLGEVHGRVAEFTAMLAAREAGAK